MKRLHTPLILAFLLFACTVSASSHKNIDVAVQEKTVSNFKGIAAGGPLNIKVTLGNTESIRFEGDQDAIAELVTEVLNGILTIKPKTKWNDWSRRHRDAEITVFINAKRLSSLTMSGSGNLEAINTISGADLVATLSGSGSIKAAANVKSFTGVLSGSGNINLSGKSDDSNLTISGSGSFKGKSFAAAKVSVQISGSADVYVKATQSLDAVISGSGSVIYSGDAQVKKTIIGSGRVSKN
jgi:PBP1b-binding outer membrane lipoprotein LpoB